MKLIVTGSGSSGNNYILTTNNGRKLLLDLGCSFIDIKKSLNFDLLSIDGCLVTHNHSDHCKSVKEFEKTGIKVWKPYLDIENKIQTKRFGNFKVTCMPVPHDDTECRAFLIECDGEKLLYATDLEYLPYNLQAQKINHLLIECNYIPEMVEDAADNRSHVIKGHCSLDTSIGIINANKTDSLKNVIFCHLSDKNCDADKVIEKAKESFKKSIWIARKGVQIELENEKDC